MSGVCWGCHPNAPSGPRHPWNVHAPRRTQPLTSDQSRLAFDRSVACAYEPWASHCRMMGLFCLSERQRALRLHLICSSHLRSASREMRPSETAVCMPDSRCGRLADRSSLAEKGHTAHCTPPNAYHTCGVCSGQWAVGSGQWAVGSGQCGAGGTLPTAHCAPLTAHCTRPPSHPKGHTGYHPHKCFTRAFRPFWGVTT